MIYNDEEGGRNHSRVKIIYYANWFYKDMLPITIRSAHTLGYETKVYDLGGLEMGEPWGGKPRGFHYLRLHSSRIFRDIREQHTGWIVRLDVDAIIVRRFDEVIGDYDIGLTKDGNGGIQSGVILINDTAGARKFLDLNVEAAKTAKNEQQALRRVVASNPPVKIKWFGWEYCYSVDSEEDLNSLPENVVVLHFGGKGWKVKRRENKMALLEYHISNRL